jgi:hypothetical protein
MIGGITNLLSNQTLTRIAQSTSSSVSIETGLKAVGRPSFILMDGDIEPETKKYAAVKEFIYQATCLATYMLLIIPVFKNGSFKIAKKCGCKFYMASDAHHLKDFIDTKEVFEKAIDLLELTEDDKFRIKK